MHLKDLEVYAGDTPPPDYSVEMELAALERFADSLHLFDRDLLRTPRFPVYLGYGDLTHDIEAVKAAALTRLFSDIHIQRYAGVHHFVPADRIYTLEHARALEDLWARGSASELALQ
jgi:hypothetical protein